MAVQISHQIDGCDHRQEVALSNNQELHESDIDCVICHFNFTALNYHFQKEVALFSCNSCLKSKDVFYDFTLQNTIKKGQYLRGPPAGII